MPRSTTVLVAALAVSLTVNLYLMTRSAASQETLRRAPSSEPLSIPAESSTPPPSRASTPQPALPPGVDCPADLAVCGETLTSCARQLDAARAEVAEFLPLEERLARGAPNPEAEQDLAPRLPAVFDEDTPELNVECRADVCKVEMIWRDGQKRGDWVRAAQVPGALGRTCGMSFASGRPTADPVTGEGLTAEELLVSLCDREAVPGIPIVQALLAELEASDAVEVCHRQAPTTGILSLRVDIATAEAPGRITIHAGGNLANTAAGICVLDKLRALADAVAIPPSVQGAVVFHTLRMPAP